MPLCELDTLTAAANEVAEDEKENSEKEKGADSGKGSKIESELRRIEAKKLAEAQQAKGEAL